MKLINQFNDCYEEKQSDIICETYTQHYTLLCDNYNKRNDLIIVNRAIQAGSH